MTAINTGLAGVQGDQEDLMHAITMCRTYQVHVYTAYVRRV